MKITNVSCKQFAGIRNCSVELKDGINVIYGKNESGKSTLVNLIGRTLFQGAKIDGRSAGKEFKNLYFPAALKSGARAGDALDGELTLETVEGTYTLRKEWGASHSCSLDSPHGLTRNETNIGEVLHGVLKYGEGVYTDMLLISQRNADTSLQTLLDKKAEPESKKEIQALVSKAFAESDGIPVDDIGAAIEEKIEVLGGQWDHEANAPKRKTGGGRWSKGIGTVLAAYYKWQDAAETLERYRQIDKAIAAADSEFARKDAAAQAARAEYEEFAAVEPRLKALKRSEQDVVRLKKELGEIELVLKDWPIRQQSKDKAERLRKELEKRQKVTVYEKAKALHDRLTELRKKTSLALCPAQKEIAEVGTAERRITTLSNKLCGMNLNAAVKMLGGNKLEVTSLRTGETLTVSDKVAITEAVRLTIPGVMEMVLTPANVDVDEITAQIEERKKLIASIFAKYKVESVDGLERLVTAAKDAERDISVVENNLENLCNGRSFEEIEADAKCADETLRSEKAITDDIRDFCEVKDLAAFIARQETTLNSYVRKYDGPAELAKKRETTAGELKTAESEKTAAENIPAKYLKVTDPAKQLQLLRMKSATATADRDEAVRAQAAAQTELNNCEKTPDELKEAVEDAGCELAARKEELDSWLIIREAYLEQKESLKNNPMADLAENFARCLALISADRITTEFPDGEKLSMDIYSSDHLLDYGKLSEGTKETVSLAFRLAVLDHLFPEGGGIVILDDPFVNMDAERTAQAAKLVRECAERHQVIFLTCKEENIDLIGGNVVRL